MNNNRTNNLGIAPVILRLYPRLDAGQRDLIRRLEGPVLGIAGPGAGKTLSVALRAANILLLGKAEPSELLLCTYNADAAVELRQRLDTVGRAAGYDETSGRRASAPSTACAGGYWPHIQSGWA